MTSVERQSTTLDAHAGEKQYGQGLIRFTNWAIAIYLVAVLAAMLALRVTPSVDVFFVFAALGALLLGRGFAFIRDWGPFLLIFFAWEGMRGIANQFGQAVHSDDVIAIERALFGSVPTVELQQALRTAGAVNALDVSLTFVYVSHFFFPLALAFAFWIWDRERYFRFVITLMAVSFAAFLTFILLPVAPPRFAGHFGEALVVSDVMEEVFAATEWSGFNWVYAHFVGNPVAAFPSMHAAYPLLVFFFLWERWKVAAVLWAPVTLTIWFATVYLGHHYVVDVLGGAAYATAGYLLLRNSDVGPRIIAAYTRAFRRAATDFSRLIRIRP
jgi:membrane-associated phospholipid phosphatase